MITNNCHFTKSSLTKAMHVIDGFLICTFFRGLNCVCNIKRPIIMVAEETRNSPCRSLTKVESETFL